MSSLDRIRCTVCKVSKPASREFFYLNPRTKTGLSYRCIACDREYQRQYRETHREERSEYMRKWAEEHPDYFVNQIRARRSDPAWKQANRESVLASKRKYRETHQEQLKAYARAYSDRKRSEKDDTSKQP